MNIELTLIPTEDGSHRDVVKQTDKLRGKLERDEEISIGKPTAKSPEPGTEAKSLAGLTTLALTFLSAGGAAALIGAARDIATKLIEAIGSSHPEAKTGKVKYKLVNSAGQTVEFDGENLTGKAVDATIKTVERFLESSVVPEQPK